MNNKASNKGQYEANIAPWLSVSNGAEALDYYKKAFGAIEQYRLEDDEGKAVIAQLSVGGADFWIQEDPGSCPDTEGRGSVRMILTVKDPDSIFDQALAAGATEVVPISEGHGWRIGRIIDPSGHHWEIGKRLS